MKSNDPQRQCPRAGFTLTEMLVATGLVVLIMLMFAQIYSVAIGTLREQRGLAQNDQKARVISRIIRSDLQNMTYRQPSSTYGDVQGIVALAAGDDPIIDPMNQRGYFYYSENERNDDTDDLIQFTVQVSAGSRGDAGSSKRSRPYIGKTASLGGAITNQPRNDNGSSAAEICYFLRNGILYRRVLLLRDPLQRQPKADTQPSNPTSGVRKYDDASPDYTDGTQAFYRDFDFAATRNSDDVLWFHSVESLDNTQRGRNIPIALPATRFGFVPAGFTGAGTSREEISSGRFFGRPTVEETSHSAFNWPGNASGMNPYTRTWTWNNGVINEFDSNVRVGEDILLTNVEAFDVQLLTSTSGATFTSAADDEGFDTFHPSASASVRVQDPTDFFDTTNMTPVQNWASGAAVSGTRYVRLPALSGNTNGQESLLYELITDGTTGSTTPEFSPVPGTVVQDGTAQWRCVDHRISIKAIQITIRFRDQTSNIPRQVTLVHSFVE